MRSYHLPVWVDRPTAMDQVQMIQQVKRLELEADVVKFRFKSKPTGPTESPRPAETRPAETRPAEASARRPVTPERERSRGRSRRKREEKSPASRPMASRSVPAPKAPKYVEAPAFPGRPPPAAPTQGLDVQYFGRKSRRIMRAILEKENWAGVGDPYLGQDGVPVTFKLYYGTRLQGPTKDSKHVDRVVCECGKVLKPNEGSLWSHLGSKHCVPEVMWKIWDVEYKVRREESPETVEPPKPAKGRAPTPAARTSIRREKPEKPAEARAKEPEEPRPEPVVLRARAEEAKKEERVEPTKSPGEVDYGSSSEISVVRGRRNTSPSPRRDTESEKEEILVEPEVDRTERTARRKRSEMTAEEKARDNYMAREAKRKRKESAAKAKGYTRRGNVRVILFDGWVQASGLEADEDPPEELPRIFDPEDLQDMQPQAPEAEEGQPGAEPPVAPPVATQEEEKPAAGGAADRPVDLGPTSKVKDLKKRLKELNAPVWGSKEILWERLREYEARLRTSREIAEELKRREARADTTVGSGTRTPQLGAFAFCFLV